MQPKKFLLIEFRIRIHETSLLTKPDRLLSYPDQDCMQSQTCMRKLWMNFITSFIIRQIQSKAYDFINPKKVSNIKAEFSDKLYI